MLFNSVRNVFVKVSVAVRVKNQFHPHLQQSFGVDFQNGSVGQLSGLDRSQDGDREEHRHRRDADAHDHERHEHFDERDATNPIIRPSATFSPWEGEKGRGAAV